MFAKQLLATAAVALLAAGSVATQETPLTVGTLMAEVENGAGGLVHLNTFLGGVVREHHAQTAAGASPSFCAPGGNGSIDVMQLRAFALSYAPATPAEQVVLEHLSERYPCR